VPTPEGGKAAPSSPGIRGEIVSVLAFVLDQERVLTWPASMVSGFAVNVTVGEPEVARSTTVACVEAPPPQLVFEIAKTRIPARAPMQRYREPFMVYSSSLTQSSQL
jgi:hypothetical protein